MKARDEELSALKKRNAELEMLNSWSWKLAPKLRAAQKEAEATAAPSPATHAILIQLKAGETADLLYIECKTLLDFV